MTLATTIGGRVKAPGHPDCLPHVGDSEFVFVDLDYNSTTEHWYLDYMFTSAHWGTDGESSSGWQPYEVEYPAKDGWYPRVFVARGKHANYAHRSDCNDGGWGGSDSCAENTDDDRLYVGYYRNIGSYSHQFINGTSTTGNPFLYPGYEYFWTQNTFCGWLGDGNCATGSYASVLSFIGFGI